MDEILKLAKELKDEIDKLPLFQEYNRVKKLLEDDPEIKQLKKEIALAKSRGDDNTHQELLARYNNHPLVVNYTSLQIEVYEYLKQVSDIVNKK